MCVGVHVRLYVSFGSGTANIKSTAVKDETAGCLGGWRGRQDLRSALLLNCRGFDSTLNSLCSEMACLLLQTYTERNSDMSSRYVRQQLRSIPFCRLSPFPFFLSLILQIDGCVWCVCEHEHVSVYWPGPLGQALGKSDDQMWKALIFLKAGKYIGL